MESTEKMTAHDVTLSYVSHHCPKTALPLPYDQHNQELLAVAGNCWQHGYTSSRALTHTRLAYNTPASTLHWPRCSGVLNIMLSSSGVSRYSTGWLQTALPLPMPG